MAETPKGPDTETEKKKKNKKKRPREYGRDALSRLRFHDRREERYRIKNVLGVVGRVREHLRDAGFYQKRQQAAKPRTAEPAQGAQNFDNAQAAKKTKNRAGNDSNARTNGSGVDDEQIRKSFEKEEDDPWGFDELDDVSSARPSSEKHAESEKTTGERMDSKLELMQQSMQAFFERIIEQQQIAFQQIMQAQNAAHAVEISRLENMLQELQAEREDEEEEEEEEAEQPDHAPAGDSASAHPADTSDNFAHDAKVVSLENKIHALRASYAVSIERRENDIKELQLRKERIAQLPPEDAAMRIRGFWDRYSTAAECDERIVQMENEIRALQAKCNRKVALYEGRIQKRRAALATAALATVTAAPTPASAAAPTTPSPERPWWKFWGSRDSSTTSAPTPAATPTAPRESFLKRLNKSWFARRFGTR